MKRVLADRFSLVQFKEWQLSAIKAAIGGKDVLVILGSGKSLCFHFPAVYSHQTAIYNDHSFQSKNIRATFQGTAQKYKSIQERVCAGEFELVFVSPESFFADSGIPHQLFTQLGLKQQLCLIAVNEAHLLRSWKTFRFAKLISVGNRHLTFNLL